MNESAKYVVHIDDYAAVATERDQLRARVNDEHNALALTDKLHADLAALTAERDALRARVAELEAQYQSALDGWHAVSSSESAIALAVGVVEVDPEAGPIGPGDPSDVLAEVRRLVESEKGNRARVRKLTEERDNAWLRVSELEAPPVVPEGWEVSSRHGAWGLLDRHGYAVDADELGVMHTSIDDCIPWSALRALAWAIEHDQRPPHAGDEVAP